MCGIAGFYNPNGGSQVFDASIKKMLSFIVHRGPDQSGYFVDDVMAMGTVRLSIIDIKSGIQPLADENERYIICFNGELYNYIELRKELTNQGVHFRTDSDTEVVLKAWIQFGDKCLLKFNGAFAFAIYDTMDRSIFIARDRYGKRPLFYMNHNGHLAFASEMKAFLAIDDFHFEFDPQQLSSIFNFWTPLPHQSSYKNIAQLPMGHFLTFKNNSLKLQQYDTLNFPSQTTINSKEEACDLIHQALAKSVELRLRSDVKVGVYLSGGLDSSIITSLTKELTDETVRTFSVEFEDQKFDESSDQKIVSKHLGTMHSSISINDYKITNHFPDAIYHGEIPVFRTAFIPMYLLSKMVKEEGIKVVLSGEGADEAFLGYNLFKDTILRKSWGQISTSQKQERLKQMYPYLDHYSAENSAYLIGLYNQFTEEQTRGLFSHELRLQNGKFSNRLLNEKFDLSDQANLLLGKEEYFFNLNPVQRAQWLEFKTLLSGYLLSTQGERMALAHGVENRCPFLDPNVVALAAQVNLKFDNGYNEKYLLKQAFKNKLPNSILSRYKQPYRAPDVSAFVNQKPDYLDLLLSESELKNMPFLNSKFASSLLKKIFNSPPDQISTKENQTFIYLLSTALLNNQFVRRRGLTNNLHLIESSLVKRIDHRIKNVELSRVSL